MEQTKLNELAKKMLKDFPPEENYSPMKQINKLPEDVEKRFDDEFVISGYLDGNLLNGVSKGIKSFISQELQEAVKKERERIKEWATNNSHMEEVAMSGPGEDVIGMPELFDFIVSLSHEEEK